jgi:hypothetical protein
LQQLISEAAAEFRREWPSDPPAEVFADEELGPDQINVLKLVYGEEVFAANADAIRSGSLIRAFGKPFLTALVLFVLRAKLGAYLARAETPNLGKSDRDDLNDGLDYLAARLGAVAVPDPPSFVRALVLAQSRALSLFRHGAPGPEDGRYVRITRDPVKRVVSDPEFSTNGLRELAAGLALLGRGEAHKLWELAIGQTQSGSAGAVKVVKDGEEAAVFFTANGAATVQLHKEGVADLDASETVVISSTEPAPAMARSPHAAYGRTGVGQARLVHVRELLKSAPDLASLEERFRQEAAL